MNDPLRLAKARSWHATVHWDPGDQALRLVVERTIWHRGEPWTTVVHEALVGELFGRELVLADLTASLDRWLADCT